MSKAKPGFIRRFFSALWRTLTWIRVSLANLVFLVIIIILVSALWPKESAQLPAKTALLIAPSGVLVDQYSYDDPLTQLLQSDDDARSETRLRDLVQALNQARDDDRITGVVLELNNFAGGGISKMQELGEALLDFKSSGKPIYAVNNSYSQAQYFLASYADKIFMHPMGNAMLTGFASYRNYFKGALDKLEVDMHVFRVGEFKDAVEPFTRTDMSEASREHNSRWIHELWSAYTSQVELNRQLPEGKINDFINHMDEYLERHQGDSAAAALKVGLVDQLSAESEQLTALQSEFGFKKNKRQYNAIDERSYLKLANLSLALDERPKVGVLVAEGTIQSGEQPAGSIGSDSMAKLLQDVRKRGEIKALVVRVDSPGGSAFASEVIRRELELTRQQGIPVLISMGSVAASGGYWISMAADEIWATPTTLTGSIGVFSIFPTLQNTLQKVGINTDGVGTTEQAGSLSLDRPLNELTSNVMQQSVNHIYQKFLTIVAQSRQTTKAQINAVGQGRVWTGRAAKDLGLVDHLGDLNAVIAAAADKASLNDYQVVEVEKPLSAKELFLRELANEMSQLGIGAALGLSQNHWTSLTLASDLDKQLQPLAQLLHKNAPRNVYAQCVECAAF